MNASPAFPSNGAAIAGALTLAFSAAAFRVSPHALCEVDGQRETIGCRHDGHIDQQEPEGRTRVAQPTTANGGSTGNGDATPLPVGRSSMDLPFYQPVWRAADGVSGPPFQLAMPSA